jgi:hypothetical protein
MLLVVIMTCYETFVDQYVKKDLMDHNTHLSNVLTQYNEISYSLYDEDEVEVEEDEGKNVDYSRLALFDLCIYDKLIRGQDIRYKFYNSNFNNICYGKYRFSVQRITDVCADMYLRFKIKDKDANINDILKEISKISVKYTIGGTTLYTCSLFFNILICKMLNKEIKLFDVNEFLNTTTVDEHMHMCYKFIHNYLIGTTKYYFEDDNGYYLDIPLLDDFYMCKNGANITSLSHHDICVTLHIDSKELFSYVDETIQYGYERLEYHNTGSNVNNCLTNYNCEYAILIPKSYNYITNSLDCRNEINIKTYGKGKFIFISLTHLYKSFNILPLILEIEITCLDETIFNLPIDNMELYEYNDSLIYGTTIDTNYCMKDWLQCENEYNDLYTICNNDNIVNNYINYNNKTIPTINNFNDKDKIKCIEIRHIKIILSDHLENISVDVTLLSQNIFRTMHGMGGTWHV